MPPKKILKLKSGKLRQHQKGQTQHQHVIVHVHAPTVPTKAPRKPYTRKPKVSVVVGSNVSLTGGGLLVSTTGQQVPGYVPNFYIHPASVMGSSSIMGQYPQSVAPTATSAMESPYDAKPNPMSSNASRMSDFTNPTAFRSIPSQSYSRSPSPSVVDMNESNVTQRSSLGHGGRDPFSAWRGGAQKLIIEDEYDFDRPIRMPSQPQVFENPQIRQRVFTKPGIIRDDVSSKSSSAYVDVLSIVVPDEPFPIDMVYSNRDDFESNNYLRRMESKPLEMPLPHPIIEDVNKAVSVRGKSLTKSPREPSVSLDRSPRESKPEHVKFQEPMDENLEFTRQILHQSKGRGKAHEPLDPGILGILAQKMYIDNFTYKNNPVAGKTKRTASQSEIIKAYNANNRTHGPELNSVQFIKDSKKIVRDELREQGLAIPEMFRK